MTLKIGRIIQFFASMRVLRVLRRRHSLGRYIIRSIHNDKHVTYASCLYITTLYDYITGRWFELRNALWNERNIFCNRQMQIIQINSNRTNNSKLCFIVCTTDIKLYVSLYVQYVLIRYRLENFNTNCFFNNINIQGKRSIFHIK